jgi:hypothetical protein
LESSFFVPNVLEWVEKGNSWKFVIKITDEIREERGFLRKFLIEKEEVILLVILDAFMKVIKGELRGNRGDLGAEI